MLDKCFFKVNNKGMKTFKATVHARGIRLSHLAESLGIGKSALSKWELGSIPIKRVLDVERITGISRHELRPDIYPVDLASSQTRVSHASP